MNALGRFRRTGWLTGLSAALLGLSLGPALAAYQSAEPDLYPANTAIPDDIGVKLRNASYRPGHAEFDRGWRRIHSKYPDVHPFCGPSTFARVLGNDYAHYFNGYEYGLRAWFVNPDNSWRPASYVSFDVCWARDPSWSTGARVTIYGDDIHGNEIVILDELLRAEGAYTPFQLSAPGMKWLKIICWQDPHSARQQAFSVDAFRFVSTSGIGIAHVVDPDNPLRAPNGMELGKGDSLSGTGSLIGDLANGGKVSPGYSAGTLTIDGNYLQIEDGVLEIELTGAEPGQFDVLEVTGSAELSGTLKVFLDGYQPEEGQQFAVLTCANYAGSFDYVTWDGHAVGWSFDVTYAPTAVVLTAVFNPAPMARLTMRVSPVEAGATTPPAGYVDVLLDEPQAISAVPVEGAIFLNWTVTGDAVVDDPEADSTHVTLSGNATVTANFFHQTYTLAYSLDEDGATITGYSGEIRGDLDIPAAIDGHLVVAIGDWAFHNCATLSNLTLGENLVSIGRCAFINCAGLLSLNIPDNVTTIGGAAFGNCTSLTEVSFGKGATTIHESVFEGCTSLISVVLPENLVSMRHRVFENCPALVSVTLPGTMTEIPWRTFRGCTSLESITLPAGITSISDAAFQGCASLQNIFFLGQTPTLGGPDVFSGVPGTVYHRYNASGWDAYPEVFGGCPTAIWPEIIPGKSSSSGFTFHVVASPEQEVVVEACNILTTELWNLIGTDTIPGAGILEFSDPDANLHPSRFYRVVLP